MFNFAELIRTKTNEKITDDRGLKALQRAEEKIKEQIIQDPLKDKWSYVCSYTNADTTKHMFSKLVELKDMTQLEISYEPEYDNGPNYSPPSIRYVLYRSKALGETQ